MSRAVVLLLASLPSTAQAFVCTRVQDDSGQETGPSVSWFRRSLGYSLFAQGTSDIPADGELTLLRQAFAPWRTAIECRAPNRSTDLTFTERSQLSSSDRIGFDFLSPDTNENLLIFRDGGWPHVGQAGQIIALTTTTYNALTGEILDADIEFNSANFNFKDCDNLPACDTSQSSRDADLLNTAVHEVGHMLGLGHPPVMDATMFAEAQPGEDDKRDLACDDRDAIVFKYPAAAANGYCQPVGTCGFCAPPNQLTAIPTVSVEDSDDGMGGCSCSAAGAPLLALAAAAGGVRRRRARSAKAV